MENAVHRGFIDKKTFNRLYQDVRVRLISRVLIKTMNSYSLCQAPRSKVYISLFITAWFVVVGVFWHTVLFDLRYFSNFKMLFPCFDINRLL